MIRSIVISGMFEVLAFMLVAIEPCAAFPREYNQILLPGDIIEGWHQAGEKYYKIERRLVIGHDPSQDHYSSTRLFWPAKESPHTTNGRITFFKCINRTPSTARTLMHVIRGGMGTPELVLDIVYEPVQFGLKNTMIIACDIYTEKNDIGENIETVLWNMFNGQKTTMRIPQAKAEAEKGIPTDDTTAKTSTTSSSVSERTIIGSPENLQGISTRSGNQIIEGTEVVSTTQGTTKTENRNKNRSRMRPTPRRERTRIHNEVTSERTGTTAPQIEGTNRKTDEESLPNQEMGQKANKTTLYTHAPGLKLSHEDSQDIGTERISSNAEKASRTTVRTPLRVTSATMPMRNRNATYIGDKSFPREETIELPCEASRNDLHHEEMDGIGSHAVKNGQRTDQIKLEAPSPEDREVQGSQTEKTIERLREEMNLESNNPGLRRNITNLKTDNKDSKDEATQTDSRSGKICLRKGKTTILEIETCETIEISPVTINKTTSSKENNTSHTERVFRIRCREMRSENNETNSEPNGTSVKKNREDSKDEKDGGSKTEDTMEKGTTSAVYNLLVKMLPKGFKKKIGLAKITY